MDNTQLTPAPEHAAKLCYINLVNNSTLTKTNNYQLEACYQSTLSGRYNSMVEVIGTLAECLAKRAGIETQYWGTPNAGFPCRCCGKNVETDLTFICTPCHDKEKASGALRT